MKLTAILEIISNALSLVRSYGNKKKKDRKVDAIKSSNDAVYRGKRFLHEDGDEN